MSEGDGTPAPTAQRFGACCSELKEAIAGQDFEPLITEGDDGVLYIAVGLIHLEDEESGMVDHPLFFCSFCGTRLQSAHEVKARVANASAGSN
jgi:hypothetical protein